MDIARPVNKRRQVIRRIAFGSCGLVAVALITVGLTRLKSAAPDVDRATVWIDVVQHGSMIREVRGLGTLVPDDIRWIPATTAAQVEKVVLRSGSKVSADSVILELSNPQLQQELQDAKLKVQSAEATLANLRVTVQNDLLAQQAQTAIVEADFKKARLQADANAELDEKGLISSITTRQSQIDSDQLQARYEISEKQLASHAESGQARLATQQAEVDVARVLLQLKQHQFDELHVRAGFAGVVQIVPVDVGQQVTPGTNLARVADPSVLKAELKIPETQAKDVQIGQTASIDTRNGLVSGKVLRIDPSVQNGTVTVDVRLTGALPLGARPDLSIDGTIELERLANVLTIGRPASAKEQSAAGLFKVDSSGEATRVQVQLGRSSVDRIEVISGLTVGEHVILSDMSSWDAFDRLRLH